MRIFTLTKNILLQLFIVIFLIGFSNQVYSQCPTVVNSNQSFCDSQLPTVASLQATDNGGGIRWYATASSTIPLPSSTILVDGEDYFADDLSGICGSRQVVIVAVYSAPTGANFQGVCVTDLSQATIANPQFSISGANLKWYTVPFGGVPISTSTVLNDNTIYYISQTNPNTGCETSRLSVFVNVGLVPVPIGNEIQEFCNTPESPPTVADLVASGDNNWYLTSDFGIPLDLATPLVDGQFYYATSVDPPCESSDRLEVLVKVNELNDAGNNGFRDICSNQVLSTPLFDLYDLLGGTPDNSGVWSGPISTTNGFHGTLDVSSMTEVGSSYVFTYTVTSVTCPPATATVTITILPLPTASVSASPTTICENGSTVLTFTGTPNATVTYNINGGANQTITLNGSGTATVNVTFTANTVVNIVSVATTGTPSCVNPQPSSITITVLPLPTASVSASPTTICENGSTMLTFTGTPNATVTYNINGGANQTITLNGSGTATVNVTLTANTVVNIVSVVTTGTPSCVNPQPSSITITVLPLPTASVSASPTTICENGSTMLTFTGTPNATVTYNINGGANQTITLNGSGTATVNVTLTANTVVNIVSVATTGTPSCVNPQPSSITITVLPLPTASVSASPTTICENGSTMLTFTGTPNATVTYNINGGANQTITLNGSGTATVNVTLTANTVVNIVSVATTGTPSCVNPQPSSITITVLPLPTASVSASPTTICENGSTMLTFTGTPNATVTYNINGGANQTITLNGSGTATVNVTLTANTVVNIVSVATTGTPSCVNPQPSSITITVLPLPTASVSASPTTICENGSTVLTFTGTPNATVTYNINGGTNQTITLNGSGTATVNVTLTANTVVNIVSVATTGTPSCVNPQPSSITITVLPLPTASVSASPTTICENGSTMLTFTGTPNATVTYNINGGANQTITLNGSGTATVNVTLTANTVVNIVSVATTGTPSCVNPQPSSITITVLPLPTASVSASPTTICENGSTVLTFTGTPNATVTYNINGGANQTITLNGSGTATVNVTLTANTVVNIVSVATTGTPSCVNPQPSSITITVLPLPTASVSASPTTICENGSTVLTFTGTPNATVTYNINGGANQTITLNGSGTATVNVTLTANTVVNIVSVATTGTPSCVNPQPSTITITVSPLPIAGVTPQPQVLCVTSPSVDLFTLLGNTAQTGGTWSPPLASGTGVFNPAVDLSGSYTYTVNGNLPCEPASVTVQVTVNPLPNAGNDVADFTICSNQDSIDLFSLLGPNAQTGGIWSPPLASGTGILNPAVDTSATYTYTVLGIAPCTDDTATVAVTITPGPEAGNSTTVTICENSSAYDLFLALGPNAQAGGTWSPQLASGTGVFNPAVDVAGSYVYSLTGSNPCDNDQATITVIVNPVPDAGNDGTHIFCTNDSPQDLFNFLNGTPQPGGTWSPPLASGTGVFNPLVDLATTYVYTIGGNLCDTDTASVTVTVVQSPIAGADGALSTCENVTSLDLTTGLDGTQDSGTWTDDNATGALSGSIFNPSMVGIGIYTFTYTVTGGTSPCTTDTAIVTVTVNPLPNAGTFASATPICPSVGTFDLNTLLTGEDNNGDWLDSANTIITNPLDVSTLAAGIYNYTYQVTNSCGNDSEPVQLEILPIPQILSANISIAPVCIGNDVLVRLSGMTDGNYTVNYNVSGVNTIGTQSQVITIVSGTGSFIISAASVSNVGLSTITFENITNTVSNCTATLSNSTAVIEIKPLLELLPNMITIANVCLGNSVVVQINSANFPDGTYQFDYTIPNGTPTTGNSGSVVITGGNGQFTIPASVFPTVGNYTLTISAITSTTECSNPSENVSVTFAIEAILNSGTFTGIISVCPSQGTLDLFSLLDNENAGGVWTDSNSQTVTSPLNIANFSPATYSYTYTVTNSCSSVATVVQFTVLPSPQISTANISIAPNCFGVDTVITLNGVVDGVYTISYDLSGSNILAGQAATVTIVSGTGSFTIPSSSLPNAGITIITFTNIVNTVSGCTNTVVNVSAQIQITPLSSIDSSNISVADVCVGDDVTVVISNATSLVNGVYQFNYSIPGANPTSGNSGNVTIASGNGQFVVPSTVFQNSGNYTINIFGIATASGCINTNILASASFTILPSLDITGATVSAQNTCVNSQSLVTISGANNLSDGNYTITYSLSGANIFTETITISITSGSAVFPLAQTNLTNPGATTITITNITSPVITCGLNGVTFPPYTFDVQNLGTPDLIQEGNLFCQDDSPTVADLSANILNGETVIWYNASSGGMAYTETDLLIHGTKYYAALVSQSGCEGTTRLEVTVDLTICDDILIPDGFSPNNDGINDTFEIKNLPIVYPNFKLEIFNRYGNLLYTGNKNTPNWDGTTSEKSLRVGSNLLPTGVYFYILYFNDGVRKPVQGRVYLSR